MTPNALALPGRLFGPGLAAAGVLVSARLDALQLSVALPDGQHLRAPLSQLGLRNAGFDGAQVEIGWVQGEQRHALLIEDAAAVARLLRDAPGGLLAAIAALQVQRRTRGVRRGLGLSAVALWLALPLLALLLLFLAARPLAGWIAGLIPTAQERQLGELVFKAQAVKLDLIQGTAANTALQRIGERLTPGSRYRYRWHIARDASVNAFAIPGGIVVVHSGLIAAAGDAGELAGVLAHEVEHVERRHSLKAMMQQAGLRLAIGAVFGDFGIVGDAAGRLSGLQFSRDSEREADRHAIDRLGAARIEPAGMLRLFAKLDASAAGAAPPVWLASHPTTPERIERLRQRIAERGFAAHQPLDIDWPAVQSSIGE